MLMNNSLEDLLNDLNSVEILSHIDLDKSIQFRLDNFLNEIKREIKNEVQKIKCAKWISVDDRLPEDNPESKYYEEQIVALNDGKVTYGYYRTEEEVWRVVREDGRYVTRTTSDIVAWMPLPEYHFDGADKMKGGEVDES